MQNKYFQWLLFSGILLILLTGSMLLSLTLGDVSISLKEFFSIQNHQNDLNYFIITQIRLPRIILALSIGGSLSLAGALLQGIFRNPLVEPYTLGISGGAAVGVALSIVSGIHLVAGALILPLSGFIGAIVTVMLVALLGFSNQSKDINKALLIGVMISFVASSTMMLLMSVSTAENLHSIIFWMMGSLDEPNTHLIRLAFYTAIGGLLISYLFVRPLNALRLGQEKARNLGINTSATVIMLFALASLLTGVCVSVVGIIGFVGLLIPHLVRLIIGSDYRIHLIASFLGGGLFLNISDMIARTIIAPNELPVGVITGISGGILFIVMMKNSKNRKITT